MCILPVRDPGLKQVNIRSPQLPNKDHRLPYAQNNIIATVRGEATNHLTYDFRRRDQARDDVELSTLTGTLSG